MKKKKKRERKKEKECDGTSFPVFLKGSIFQIRFPI